jgi:pimeloyl-ACP methyl ester carboxylesterase
MPPVLIESDTVNNVPLLTAAPLDAHDCPVVFFVPGFMSQKARHLELGYHLAKQGIFYVSLDAAMHGERPDPRLDQVWDPNAPHIYPPESELDSYALMLEIADRTAKDIDGLIEHFGAQPQVDASRVGVCGDSMGGYITFLAAARNPKVRAIATIIAHPAFTQSWLDDLAQAESNPDWADRMAAVAGETARLTAFVRSIDPYEKLGEFCPKPLLMINGDRDTVVPIQYALQFYRDLKPSYQAAKQAEKLKLSVYRGIDHRVVGGMLIEAAGWFQKHL